MKDCIPIDKRPVTVALLAAGCGRRFGGDKLDANCAGKPLGQWAVEAIAAAGLDPGICVTGPARPRFLESAQGWEQVVNPAPEAGLGFSLALAARHAEQAGNGALLVVLADMPLVAPAHLRVLAACASPAATGWGEDRPGVPALLPANLLPQIAALSGDAGAARILNALPDLVLLSAPPGSLLDVDTPEDLARAEAVLRERPAPGRDRR